MLFAGNPIAAVFTYNYALAKDALSQHVLRAAEKAAIAKDMVSSEHRAT